MINRRRRALIAGMKSRRKRSAEGVNHGRPVVTTNVRARSPHLHMYISCAVLLVIVLSLVAKKLARTKETISICGNSTQIPLHITYKQILKTASKPFNDPKHTCLNTLVLGYVTPWNAKGYDMARKYRAKFTHISPVWYQLKRDTLGLSFVGRHNADLEWIEDVRQGGSPLIVPRVAVEGWFLETTLTEPSEKKQAISFIVDECSEMNYDGVVLEAWSLWATFKILINPRLRQRALEFIRDLGKSLHKTGKKLLLVIPPIRGQSLEEFTLSDLEFLQNSVDAFSLMTYDYSNLYNPGPNAPLFWVSACLSWLVPSVGGSPHRLASQVLVGINFYGNDYELPRGGGPILGDQFLDLLEQHKPKLVWDSINREHYVEYVEYDHNIRKKHRVYYPSLQSIELRLQEASISGAGISIWEIGQGLEHFFDLL